MEKQPIENIRHSLAHVMAAAVQDLYPGVKFGMGPAIDNGFYYDFDLPEGRKIVPEDLAAIENKMREILASGASFEREDIQIGQAEKVFNGQKYKLEIVADLKAGGEEKVSIYRTGEFVDLCKGPHVVSAKELPADAFKLTKIAGAYWKGSEKNAMLTRIYAAAFANKKELEEYLKQQEEAEKRDHRKLGKELDLFVTSDLVGKGLPLLTPKGSIIRQILERFIVDEETRRGYSRTYTPDLAKVDLYKKSGHWDHYKENMYPPITVDGEDYVLRPMCCPHQFMIYNSRPHSYRELPIRYAEIAKLYRKEQSGELSGLIRVMSFSLVDAHIVCRPDQVEEEFARVIDLIQYVMKTLGIKDYWYRFSKWDPANKEGKYVNDPAAWEKTEASMKKIIDSMKLEYIEAENEAAFYGPKLDVQLRNVNGKEDTAFTVQIDFSMPNSFDMTYIDQEGKAQRPMVIHRSSIGCIERTMAFLIEQYAGAFPVWLSPVQAKILPVSEKHGEYARKLAEELMRQDVRVELDDSNETVGNKIRKAVAEKSPYVLVIGDKEIESGKLSVRDRGSRDTREIGKEEFVKEIKDQFPGKGA
ncbi:MAG: threonine--tRNA ligase [Candidatus Paceibacterota bacterium]|jgi:threonyl-tRNA synthetase